MRAMRAVFHHSSTIDKYKTDYQIRICLAVNVRQLTR